MPDLDGADFDTRKALQLWLDRHMMGSAGEPMDDVTDKAIDQLQRYRDRRRATNQPPDAN